MAEALVEVVAGVLTRHNGDILACQRAAVLKAHHVVFSIICDPAGAPTEMDPQPFAAYRLGERVAERTRLAREDVLHPFDEVNACPQRRERLRHLNPHRSAPQDHHTCRDLPDPGGFTVGPDTV